MILHSSVLHGFDRFARGGGVTAAEQNDVDRNIQKGLDDQLIRKNYAIAQDDAQIRTMQEQREIGDLAGLGNAVDTARQDMNMGMNTALNGAMSIASSMKGQIGEDPKNAYGNTFSSKYKVPSSIGWEPSKF